MKSSILVARIMRVIETDGQIGDGAGLADAYADAVKSVNARMEAVHDAESTKQVSDAVRRAALIIDNRVASSGEALVECLKATSNRTTVYGRDNTEGCLDFANCNQVPMPNSGIDISVPMSRRVGLPETGIDATGIAPDVRIDLPLPSRLTDNIDEWVIWVAEQLEK